MKSRKVTSMAQCVCNRCKKVILISRDILGTTEDENGIRAEWFRCPECGIIYVYSVTDPELRAKIKQNGIPTAEMKKRMEELRKQFGKICLSDSKGKPRRR